MPVSILKLKKFFRVSWPFILILFTVGVFFYPVIIQSKVPLPGDFIVGTYFPWLDYKWGYAVGVPVKNPITSDVVSVIYPLKSTALSLLKNFTLNLWNPYMFSGYPLLANMQIALFSPTNIFYLFFPMVKGWTLQVIMQPFLAAIFSYLFLRNLKMSKFSSMMGGLFYAFSGFNIIWLEWNAHSLVAAFIPLILLSTDKFISKTEYKWFALLSVSVTLQLLSGYPQLFLYTLIALASLILIRRSEVSFKKLLLIVVSLGWGVLLASLQTVPALELFIRSQRTQETLTYDLLYLPWENLITFLAPDYYGNHSTGNFWGIGNYTNNVGYSGLIVTFLALNAAFVKWTDKYVKYFVFLCIISLLLSLPNPLSYVIPKLGVFGAASNTRVLVLANLGLSYLAAKSIDLMLFKKTAPSMLPAIILLSVLILVFATTLFVSRKLLVEESIKYDVGLRNLVLPLILAVIVFITIKIRKNKPDFKLGIYILAFLAVAELMRFGWKYTPFSDPSFAFPKTPVIDFIDNQAKPFRVLTGDVIPMNMWVPYKWESPAGYDAVYPADLARFIAVTNKEISDGSMSGRYGAIYNYQSKLLDLLAVKYLLFVKKDEKGEPSRGGTLKQELNSNRFKTVFEDNTVVVVENMTSFPKAFMVYDYIIENKENTLEKLLEIDFPLRKKIILSEKPELEPAIEAVNSSVVYTDYYQDAYGIKVFTEKAGLLFVSDSYYPGWNAFIDGKESKIYKANYAFRAVIVPEGDHEVVFKYRPESYVVGLKISIIFLFLLIILPVGKRVLRNYTRRQ